MKEEATATQNDRLLAVFLSKLREFEKPMIRLITKVAVASLPLGGGKIGGEERSGPDVFVSEQHHHLEMQEEDLSLNSLLVYRHLTAEDRRKARLAAIQYLEFDVLTEKLERIRGLGGLGLGAGSVLNKDITEENVKDCIQKWSKPAPASSESPVPISSSAEVGCDQFLDAPSKSVGPCLKIPLIKEELMWFV